MKLIKVLENIINEKFNAVDAVTEMQAVILSTGISETAADQMTDMMKNMSDDEIKVLRSKFQSMNIQEYVNGGWKTFEKFFEVKGSKSGTGRGELMAVMSIKGASSGGTEKKDLNTPGGTYEIKEGPDTIRMAKSGFAGLFAYVDKIKAFYKLLEALGVNDRKNDEDLLKKLNEAFNSSETAKKIFNVLIKNFRGDEYKAKKGDAADQDIDPVSTEDFFYRTKVAAELPPSVIQLHYDGFKILKEEKSNLLKNDALLKNAKMLVKFKDQTPEEYWISSDDAEELKTAKVNSTVSIKKGAPAESSKVFMYNLLEIFNHPYTSTPSEISKDFSDRKYEYFSEIKGILCYETGNPQPFIMKAPNFIVSGISQNMGKMRRRKQGDAEWIKLQT